MDGMNKEKWLAMTRQQKREHIWEYYRGYIVSAVLVLIVGAWMIGMELSRVDPQMSVIITDLKTPLDNDQVFHPFLEEYGYEVYDKAVEMNQNIGFNLDEDDESTMESNGSAYEMLYALVSTKTRDVLIAPSKVFGSCVNDGALLDLTEVLPAELLERHNSHILMSVDTETGESYPCGVRITRNPWTEQMQKGYTGYAGILKNCDDMDKATNFIIYLLNQFNREG